MSMLLTMEILRVASLLLPFCLYSIFCFPTRPLNERSTELAWQAWLLVDDQNQNKHYDSDNFTRRRITPKSVFIAPTFSPESLPACAEGYRPDSMGRCIKIIKLDEEAHLDFLLEKLNAQFGNYDELDEESQEDMPTAGPFQLNIPLGGADEDQTKDRPHGNLDIAIVVAPTNGNFGLEDDEKSVVKKTDLINGNSQTEVKTPANENNPEAVDTNANSKRKTENQFEIAEQVEAITVTVETTTFPDPEAPTTVEETDKDTTFPSDQTTLIETTTTPNIETDTTISHQHALFFLKPSLTNTEHVQNGTNNAEDTPVITLSDDSVVISNHSLTTPLSNSTLLVNTSINLSNKQPVPADLTPEHYPFKSPLVMGSSADSGDLSASENMHHSADFIRFPATTDEEEPMKVPNIDYKKYPEQIPQTKLHTNTDRYASQFTNGEASHGTIHQEQKLPSSEQFGTLFSDYIHSRGADLKGNERFVFNNRQPVPEVSGNLESGLKHAGHTTHDQPYDRLQSNGGYEPINERVFNHRNRDKHSNLWSLPPSWSESSPQKPIVLRFSRRSSNSRHLLEEHLRPHTQNSQTYYRQVPSEDFSYIFGVKQESNRRRNHR